MAGKLKISDVSKPILDAVKKSLGKDWSKYKDLARPEFKKLAQALVDITHLAAAGKMNQQQAKAILGIHKNATQAVLLMIEGLGFIAVQNAINAALKAVKQIVNTAAGVAIL